MRTTLPSVNVATVMRMANEIADVHALPVTVLASVASCSGSPYVEIMFRIDGCPNEPCRVQIGVFRNVAVHHLRDQIRRQLKQHLSRRGR